jgi:hypothetical protein
VLIIWNPTKKELISPIIRAYFAATLAEIETGDYRACRYYVTVMCFNPVGWGINQNDFA